MRDGRHGRWRHTPAALLCIVVGVAAAGLGVVIGDRPDGRLRVEVLAAGDGVAVLVRAPDGALALIDTGGDPAALAASLGAALPTATHTLDLLVLTGGTRGEAGGLADLGRHVEVAAAVSPVAEVGVTARQGLARLGASGTLLTVIPPGTAWSWHGLALALRALPPDTTGLRTPPVAVLELEAPGGRVLVLGAAGIAQEEELAATAAAALRSDLLVTPAGGAVPSALLAAVRPRAVAVPGSHPPRVAALRALAAGTRVRSTAAAGTLVYVGDGATPLGEG